ncbi:MAG: gfo/Idh/MocA family oxidoreductase, partial [Planctomycetaceae bacterium]
GGASAERPQRLQQIRQLEYADLAADRQVVAAIEAMERILEEQAAGRPDRVARYDGRTIQLH